MKKYLTYLPFGKRAHYFGALVSVSMIIFNACGEDWIGVGLWVAFLALDIWLIVSNSPRESDPPLPAPVVSLIKGEPAAPDRKWLVDHLAEYPDCSLCRANGWIK